MRIRVIAAAVAMLVTAGVVTALEMHGSTGLLSATISSSKSSQSSQSVQIAKTPSAPCSAIDRAPGWVARENAHKGTLAWKSKVVGGYSGDGRIQRPMALATRLITQLPPVSGWFDRVSVNCGDQVGLHLSGRGKPIKVDLYRTGYYQGKGARLVWSTTTAPIPFRSQVNITPNPAHKISTPWPVSVELKITGAFPPGMYLAKLNDGWKATYVPLTIRDDQSKAAILFVSSVLTGEAYNHWGGSSLYRGTNGSAQTRSRIVSFDRPYDGNGADQYLIHEFGLVKLAEKLGIDITYTTDIDLNNNPEQVRRHRSIIFGGHSEYWTASMRNAAELARATGVNIANFGANVAYWRTRLEDNGRSVAVWRDNSDPYKNDPAMRTNRWRDGLLPRPESLLFGVQYAGLGVKSDYRVLDAKSWPFLGTGLATNQLIDGVVGKEVDSPDAGPGPAVQFLTSSIVRIKKKNIRVGMTYYTTLTKSGVIDASTDGWVCAIEDLCNWGHLPAKTSRAIAAVTKQTLEALAAGPLGIAHPAKLNIAAR